jgi:hypothetical protein
MRFNFALLAIVMFLVGLTGLMQHDYLLAGGGAVLGVLMLVLHRIRRRRFKAYDDNIRKTLDRDPD